MTHNADSAESLRADVNAPEPTPLCIDCGQSLFRCPPRENCWWCINARCASQYVWRYPFVPAPATPAPTPNLDLIGSSLGDPATPAATPPPPNFLTRTLIAEAETEDDDSEPMTPRERIRETWGDLEEVFIRGGASSEWVSRAAELWKEIDAAIENAELGASLRAALESLPDGHLTFWGSRTTDRGEVVTGFLWGSAFRNAEVRALQEVAAALLRAEGTG